MLLLIQVICLVSVSASDSDFFSGFLSGLLKSQTQPSECVLSIQLTEFYYSNLMDAELSIYKTKELLYSFSIFFNQLTQTVNICKVQSLFDEIFSLFTPDNMKNFEINALGQSPALIGYYKNLQQAIASQDVFSEGFYTGKIFSSLFNYRI
jgi:hypothetical protein